MSNPNKLKAISILLIIAASAAVVESWSHFAVVSRSLRPRDLDSVRGTTPNQRLLSGADFCSGNGLQGTQRATYNCDGNLGSPCIFCGGKPTAMSGIQNALYNDTIQNAGGSNISCSDLEKWLATCRRDTNQPYFCDQANGLDTGTKCTGDYPPYGFQIIASIQATGREVGPSGLIAMRTLSGN